MRVHEASLRVCESTSLQFAEYIGPTDSAERPTVPLSNGHSGSTLSGGAAHHKFVHASPPNPLLLCTPMDQDKHRSISGVCTYKRVSDDQKETLSNILNSTTNAIDCPLPQKKEKVGLEQTLPHAQTQLFELQSSERDFPTLNLSGCSSINYTVH